MIEEKLEIALADGTAEAILYRPEGEGPWPGILHLTDIWGIRPNREAMARRQAAAGYAVLLPNIFYRAGRVPLFDFAPQIGEARTMKRIGELFAALPPAAMDRDGAAYADFLLAHPSVKGRLGVVGYCFSGAMALHVAAVRPGEVAVAVSFHGGRLFTGGPDSPHLLLPRIKARLYFGHAVEDPSMTPEMIAGLEAALAAWGGPHESETYAGARHGWTLPGGEAYAERAAERAFARLMELFGAAL